jgi:hypothetical protein
MKTARAEAIANDSPFCEAHARVDDLIKKLTSAEAMGAPITDIERLLAKEGTEFIRSLFQAYVDARAAAEQPVEVIGSDGVARPHVRTSTRTIETPFGEISVTRKLYRAVGVPAIAPLDAALGLPEEKYTMELRRIVAEEASKSSFDEVVELIDKRTGASVPKRQVEELTERAAQAFDAFYADRLREAEATDDLLVLSFDGKGIAMRHKDLREATRKAAEATPRTLHSRLAKGEKPNRKRMAQVAAIYSLPRWRRTISDVLHGLHDPKERDAKRPRPVNKRVWASIEHGAQQVVEDAFAEGLRRDPERKRRWVVLVDGQRDQIERVKRTAKKVGVEITLVLDIVHVLEYLWRAAYAFCAEGHAGSRNVGREPLARAAVRTSSGGDRQESARDDRAPRPRRESGQARRQVRELPRKERALAALLHQVLDDAEQALALLLLLGLGGEQVGQRRGVVHHLGEDHGAGRRQRPARPPEVQRRGVAVTDGFLARRGLVDGLEREGDFDELPPRGHGRGTPMRSANVRASWRKSS